MKKKKTYCKIGGCKKARSTICCCECKLPDPTQCPDFCRNDPTKCGLAWSGGIKGRRKKGGKNNV